MGIEEEVARAASETLGKVVSEVYGDVARPATREIGTALGTVFKIGLSPVAMLDWGFEQSKEWLTRKVEERFREIPPESRQSPPARIAIPAIQAIAMTSDTPELRGLYAELLMKAMDARVAATVHPSFLSLVGQMSPQEALVLVSLRYTMEGTNSYSLFNDRSPSYGEPWIEQQFSEHCASINLPSEQSQMWLENLLRLRVVEMSSSVELVERDADKERPAYMENVESRSLFLTEYGRAFLEACSPPSPAAVE